MTWQSLQSKKTFIRWPATTNGPAWGRAPPRRRGGRLGPEDSGALEPSDSTWGLAPHPNPAILVGGRELNNIKTTGKRNHTKRKQTKTNHDPTMLLLLLLLLGCETPKTPH